MSGGGEEEIRPIQMGSRLELFVDDFLIDRLSGARLKLHAPQPAGKVLSFDKPWEGATSTYVAIFRDEARYRMYYRGSGTEKVVNRSLLKAGESIVPEHAAVVCYAESPDGIHWTKPLLGLWEFQGSKENNIVWMGPGADNFYFFQGRESLRPCFREVQRAGGLSAVCAEVRGRFAPGEDARGTSHS